jgi:hypothetical protein
MRRSMQPRGPASPQALPAGWEPRETPDGQVYYANHNDRTTYWTLPCDAGAQLQVPHKRSREEFLRYEDDGWQDTVRKDIREER